MTFDTLWEKYEFKQVQARIENSTRADVERALGRVRSGLSLDDFSALLSPAAVPYLETMAQLAHRQTVERFGRTMQLYVPLYLSNVCSNLCTYCGFSAQNPIPRKTLTDDEIVANAKVLDAYGFEHVLLLTGESPKVGVSYLRHALRLLRPYFSSLSLEVQPLSIEDYTALVAEGVNAVMVYQETYDPEAYTRHHLRGPKADIRFRLNTPDRLSAAGVKKIGLGALYGLSQWRADAWFVGLHLRYLEKHHWRTRANISFPRLRPHEGQQISMQQPFREHDLVHVLCAFRLLSQEVELSLSTRESAHFRDHAFRLGVTSMSAGSRTDPGGYTNRDHVLQQFEVDDIRSPAEVAHFLRRAGYEPVWKDWDSTYDGCEGGRTGIQPFPGLSVGAVDSPAIENC